MVRREWEQEVDYLTLGQGTDGVVNYIKKGFVPNMRVPGIFYANDAIRPMLLDELRSQSGPGSGRGGFLPALRQIANVASLPGIQKYSIGLPDCHAGYGFAIGNVAAMDMEDPEAVVSPGGVGFDICCGVRLIRTNLSADDIAPYVQQLTNKLYELIPVGVGRRIGVPIEMSDLNEILKNGMAWAVKHGYATQHDREHIEEHGCVPGADPDNVSGRAKERGLYQLGTLGAGNHYCEVQKVQKIYDVEACHAMGINDVDQICIMIHSGSRGLGHQVCTDYIQSMRPFRTKYNLNDQQLTCAPIKSSQGEKYLSALAAASNFAFCNRSAMTTMVRRAFYSVLDRSEREMEMRVIYDVAHNTAKVETHTIDGRDRQLLVHRKGATRAFPPGHPNNPHDYMNIGQPVLVGGSMGSASYVLTGTDYGMETTFGSTCHGAGRLLSRHQARNAIKSRDTLAGLKAKGVTIKVGNAKLVSEEDVGSYKDVDEVVNSCESAKISKRAARLVPVAVIKG